MGKRIALSAGRAVGFVLLMGSLTAAVVLFCVRHVLLDESVYHTIPEADGFVEQMTDYVLQDLNHECDLYENGEQLYAHLTTAVSKEWIASLSRQYAESVYQSLMTGEALQSIIVDPATYRQAIDSFAATLPEDERPDAATVQDMSQTFADSTATVLQSGLVDKVLPTAHQYIYGNATVLRLSSLFGWSLEAVALLLALNLIWVNSDLRRRAYATAGSLFLGSTLVAVPLWMLQRHGIAERLVLGDGPLKLYVSGMINALVDRMAQASRWVLIVCAALLIASVVWNVWPTKKQKENQESNG